MNKIAIEKTEAREKLTRDQGFLLAQAIDREKDGIGVNRAFMGGKSYVVVKELEEMGLVRIIQFGKGNLFQVYVTDEGMKYKPKTSLKESKKMKKVNLSVPKKTLSIKNWRVQTPNKNSLNFEDPKACKEYLEGWVGTNKISTEKSKGNGLTVYGEELSILRLFAAFNYEERDENISIGDAPSGNWVMYIYPN